MRPRPPHLLALGLVALAALPASAGALTFGADPSRPASTTAPCARSFSAVATVGVRVVTTKATLKAPRK
jgi:hypothetical protein